MDTNIISDYRKIEGFLNLCKDERRYDILEKIVAGEPIESELTEKFNSEVIFGEKELVSLLFYLGYLTIVENGYRKCNFKAPNDVIKSIYSEYYLAYLSKKAKIEMNLIDTEKMNYEILECGKINTIIETLGKYLESLSNRDYIRFDEKYVKVIFYSICKMLGTMVVKSELEVGGGFADILLIPREKIKERYGVLIEFKYIKQEEYEKDRNLLIKKQEEAKLQIEKYKNSDEVKIIPNIKCYSVVAVKDKIFMEEL